jgi:thymidylate synthase (FAD)
MNIYDDGHGEVVLLQTMGEDATPAHSARVSFGRDERDALTERDVKLINYLADHHHTTPFEHQVATFRITCPLFVARQIMRHRTFSYNELSRRYTSEDLAVWRPQKLRKQHDRALQCSTEGDLEGEADLLNLIDETVDHCLEAYERLIDAGVARELARAILPVSCYTSFWMTGNLRNWAHFLKLRLDEHTQPEAREVAEAIRAQLVARFPVSIDALL